jgi:hypothetical protein
MSGMEDTNDVEYRLDDEITVVFRKISARTLKLGEISLAKGSWETAQKWDILEGADELEGAVQYYKIDTENMDYRGIIKIRIGSEQATQGQIFEWRRGWKDRTLYCVNVGKYKLIVGVTDHLSGFGIR